MISIVAWCVVKFHSICGSNAGRNDLHHLVLVWTMCLCTQQCWYTSALSMVTPWHAVSGSAGLWKQSMLLRVLINVRVIFYVYESQQTHSQNQMCQPFPSFVDGGELQEECRTSLYCLSIVRVTGILFLKDFVEYFT